MTCVDDSTLVFYLLEEDLGVGTEPVTQYASDYQELVLDELTPQFRSHVLSAQGLGLEAAYTLTARRKESFVHKEALMLLPQADESSRRELELLREWCQASERPILAYQLEFGPTDYSLGRVDDVALVWENADANQRAEVLNEAAAFVVKWYFQNQALASGAEEGELLSELLSATRQNLPFYAHVFEQLVGGQREIFGLPGDQHIRLADYACKMFLRFPSYLLKRCLPRESSAELQRRASYIECLSSAFRYNLAPISLDEFCDYLATKADCDARARVDLAWFIGELSHSGRSHATQELLSA